MALGIVNEYIQGNRPMSGASHGLLISDESGQAQQAYEIKCLPMASFCMRILTFIYIR